LGILQAKLLGEALKTELSNRTILVGCSFLQRTQFTALAVLESAGVTLGDTCKSELVSMKLQSNKRFSDYVNTKFKKDPTLKYKVFDRFSPICKECVSRKKSLNTPTELPPLDLDKVRNLYAKLEKLKVDYTNTNNHMTTEDKILLKKIDTILQEYSIDINDKKKRPLEPEIQKFLTDFTSNNFQYLLEDVNDTPEHVNDTPEHVNVTPVDNDINQEYKTILKNIIDNPLGNTLDNKIVNSNQFASTLGGRTRKRMRNVRETRRHPRLRTRLHISRRRQVRRTRK
jgi:hypothetical protein